MAAAAVCLGQSTLANSTSNVAPASDSTPIDWSLRRKVFFRRLFGPNAVWETLPGLAFDEARNFPHEWGRGFGGITKRFGSQYGQFVVSETIELGVAAVHREDPRYHRLVGHPFGERVKHTLASVFVVRDDKGGRTVALGRFAGVYGATAASLIWNPADQRNLRSFTINSSIPFAAKAGSNAWQEFWPDVTAWRHRRALRKATTDIDKVVQKSAAAHKTD